MSDPLSDVCDYCGSPDVLDDAWFCGRSACWAAYEADCVPSPNTPSEAPSGRRRRLSLRSLSTFFARARRRRQLRRALGPALDRRIAAQSYSEEQIDALIQAQIDELPRDG